MKNVGASYIIDLCTISTSTARTHFSKKCSMACPRQSGVFGEVNVCDSTTPSFRV